MSTILVVEDEPDIVRGLQDALEHDGYQVLVARDGEEGLELGLSGQPDLIVLDIMLPKLSGFEVCRRLRKRDVTLPVIMLTARGQEEDVVEGLESGADDYVRKPFSIQELRARIRARLRRRGGEGQEVDQVRIGDALVDFKKYMVFRGDEQFELTDREVGLLRLLIAHPHEVVSRDRILDEVWGFDAYPSTRTIDTFMYRLRKKIEADSRNPRHLITVRGAGYKFVP